MEENQLIEGNAEVEGKEIGGEEVKGVKGAEEDGLKAKEDLEKVGFEDREVCSKVEPQSPDNPLSSPRKSTKPDCSPPKLSIPILNRDTVDSNTYDYSILLDTKVQKEAFSGHRIKNSQTVKIPKSHPKKPFFSKLSNSASCKLIHSQSAKQQKLETLRQEQLKNELKECTFAPRILEIRKARSPEEYYQDQMKFEEKKNQKLKNIQKVILETEESELSSYSFVPNITEKSAIMASKHLYQVGTYERMTKGFKPKVKIEGEESQEVEDKPKDEFTFTPNLNIRSKNMLRIGQVEDILYEDAKRRQKLKNEHKPGYAYEVNVNSNSEKVLIEKFYKEFVQICDFDNLCFSDLNMILQGLHMMLGNEKNKSKEKDLAYKLWERLTMGQEGVSSEKVMMHLMAIMKYQTSIFTDSEEAISPEETDVLHLVYFLFFENRNSVVNHSSFNRSVKTEPSPAFQPEISVNSKKILEDVSFEHILKRWEMKKMGVIQELDEKNYGECTFQPIIYSTGVQISSEDIRDPLFKEYVQISNQPVSHRAEALYSFASVEKEKKQDFIKAERTKLQEKELANCTFVPNSDKKNFEKPKPEDIKRCIERLAVCKSETKVEKNSKKNLKKTNSNAEEREKILKDWEERKLREIKKVKLEMEMKKRVEREQEEQRRRKVEEDKKVKYERLKRSLEEKKIKAEIDKKLNSKVKTVSVLGSEEEEHSNVSVQT